LDQSYPSTLESGKKYRSEVRIIYIDKQDLEGELDLKDFKELKRIYIS